MAKKGGQESANRTRATGEETTEKSGGEEEEEASEETGEAKNRQRRTRCRGTKEQAAGDGESLTKATDGYGLGAVLYFLLTGHPPFAGGTTYETIRLVLETEPRNPRLWNSKVDRDLSTIALKCLEKDSQRRYSSALALAEYLERWMVHEPVQRRPAGFF